MGAGSFPETPYVVIWSFPKNIAKSSLAFAIFDRRWINVEPKFGSCKKDIAECSRDWNFKPFTDVRSNNIIKIF